MTDTGDDSNRTLSTITGTMTPVSTDKTPLVWDGNDANILGLLFEVKRYYTNKGLFQTLFRDRAVSLSNGKLAIEHPSAIWFLSGVIDDAVRVPRRYMSASVAVCALAHARTT